MKPLGELISAGVDLYYKRFRHILEIGFYTYALPAIIILAFQRLYLGPYFAFMQAEDYVFTFSSLGAVPEHVLALYVLTVVASWAVSFLFTLAIISFAGGADDWRSAYRHGKRYFWPALGLSLFLFFALFGLFLLFIIPAILFGVYWSFSYYAMLLDNKGVSESLARSKALVTGRWWRVFGYSLVFSIGVAVVQSIAGVLIGIPVGVYALFHPVAGDVLLGSVSTLLSALFGTPMTVILTVKLFEELKATADPLGTVKKAK